MGELAAARDILAALGDVGPTWARARRGANCTVYLGERHVVRVGRAWPLDTAAEIACWRAARAVGVPAPQHCADGVLDSGAPYLVYLRQDGVPACGSRALRAAGAVLARLHTLPGSVFPQEQRCRPRRRERYGTAADAIDLVTGRRRATARRWLAAAAEDWSANRSTAVHGDFRADNLLVKGGRVGTVLDWSDARAAGPECDLGQCAPADLAGLLAGYVAEAAKAPGFGLIAGHMLARHLALEACRVLPAGSADRLVHDLTAGPLLALRDLTHD